MDASSAPFAGELQRLFPDAWFQAKGLMATEGAVTVPFGEGPGSPLAVDSGFFEFVDGERVHPAWELEHGRTYRVLLSNRFGLYRYDTADLVQVVGFTAQTPRLVFKGRAGLATDLCGEKLTEEFVLSCMEAASDGPRPIAILTPSSEPHPHYVLYANRDTDSSGSLHSHPVWRSNCGAIRNTPMRAVWDNCPPWKPVSPNGCLSAIASGRHRAGERSRG